MRMLVNVSNHMDEELEYRIRHGKRLINAAIQRAKDARDRGDINDERMHHGYGLYIQRCVDQAQHELDRRRS